jgi:hypothetical protein
VNNDEAVDIKILYLCVHKRCDDKVGLDRVLTKENYYKMLGEIYHVPKVLRVIVLKEMAKLRMLKEIDNRHIEVLPLLTNPESNVNRFYRQIGLFD